MLTLDTLAPNLTRVIMGSTAVRGARVVVWFSYETPVAVQHRPVGQLLVSANEWGSVTGKHLSMIDGGDHAARVARVPHATIMAEVDRLTPAPAR